VNAAGYSVFTIPNSFTIAFVYKPTDTSGLKGLVSFGSGLAYVRANGTALEFLAAQVAFLGSFSGSISAGNRYLIIVTVDATNASQFYLNGSSSGTGSAYGGFGSANTIYIGSESGGYDGCNGGIDEVLFLRRIITPTEIADLTAAGGF
jgi:hypothetical protein